MSMTTRGPVFTLSILSLAALTLVSAPLVHASGDASVSVDEFSGSFSTEVPIKVPPFRGLQPAVALSYNSQGGNGFVGVGWSVTGSSVIERVGPGRGAPTYPAGTETDEFTLDGQPLVACTPAMTSSPSCTTGGTHVSKTESYLRIQRDTAANTWLVWSKDGTRRTFSPIFNTARGTFRWGLTEVRDTGNQVVTHTWSCDGSPILNCYLDTISYNLTEVKFYRALRPDPIIFSTGNTTLGKVQYRLTAVGVKVNGLTARVLQLAYDPGGRVGRSYLASVQQLGTDATVSADGLTVTGTAMPARTFGRQAGALGLAPSARTGMYLNASPDWNFAGDYDGDGKPDLLAVQSVGWGTAVYHLNWGKGGSTSYTAGHINGTAAWTHAADFTGDGRDDLLSFYVAGWGTGTAYLTSFDGAGARTVSYRTGLYVNGTAAWNIDGDFNGDGKMDVLAVYATGWGTAQVYVNHVASGTFLHDATGVYLNASRDWTFVGDFNGDGKADLLSAATASQGFGTAYVNYMNAAGTAFDTPTLKSAMYINGAPAWNRVGDFNGDGKQDLLSVGSTGLVGAATVYVNYGSGPAVNMPVGTYTTLSLNAGPEWLHLGDFDGDGLTDLLSVETSGAAGVAWVNYSTGAGFLSDRHSGVYVNATAAWNSVGDFNGDGRADLSAVSATGWGTAAAYFNHQAAPVDQTSCVGNELGGTSTVSYAASSAWANTNNPPVSQTIASVTVADGRGGSATTGYSYSGGLYDPAERRFLGFRYVKEAKPCIAGESQCPYEETWFKQDYGSASKPERTDLRRGDGVLLASRVHEHTTNGATVPYTSVETGTWEYVYDGTGGTACPGVNCKRTYLGRSYDGYGNVTQQLLHGDYDASGDESTVRFQFRPNPSAFIVGKPAAVDAFAGLGTAGELLTQALLTYDGNATWDAAPTAGQLRSMAQWLDTPSSYVTKSFAYDAWGNLASETDALGGTRTYGYDATYHVYRTTATNALGQTGTSTWDPVCGVETGGTDLNGFSNTSTLDALCRVTRRDGPLGLFELRTYNNLGDPATQYLESQTNGANTNGNYWAREYRDGLGRVYRKQSKGASVGSDVLVDVSYHARGQEAGRTAPYYTGATPQWTSLAYDALDRVTRQTAPDGAFSSASYGLWSVTRTNELGHVDDERTDAFGRLLQQREQKSDGTWVTATHAYNARGEKVSITDAAGHVRTWSYDSLGRKRAMTDPNAGAWSYGYDAGGNLTVQTDAKGQRVELGYDLQGRKTRKVAKRADGSTESTVTWTFDEPRTGYANRGKLTTMVDAAGSATYDYDAGGRPVKVSRTLGGRTYTLTRGFDAAGRLLWTSYPDGDAVGTPAAPLGYDDAGRASSVPGLITGAQYTAAGALTVVTNANGTTTTRAYSATRGWLTGIATLTGTTTLQNLAYAHDAGGRVTGVTSPFANEGWTYAYDALNQLTAATNTSSATYNQTLAYANNGNVTSNSRLGSYGYGTQPHAVTAAGANAYSYDANGNMVSGAGRTITWNVDNLPATVGSATFTYDGNGSRLKKVVAGDGGTTIYLGDDYEIAGGAATKYVSFGGVLAAKRVGTTSYWLHTDHQGSIQVVTDASGLEVQRLTYRPDGDRLATATGHVEKRGFAAQRQDESGLFYLHARYYDPLLGRFISPDPALDGRTVGAMNGYAYAGNDPVNTLDVDGQFSLKKLFKKVAKAFGKLFKSVLRLIGGVVSALAVLPVTLGVGAFSPEHMGRFITEGGFFTAEGRDEFTAGMMDMAMGLNRIPMVGGLLALPFVSMGALAQGDFGTALRSAATFVIAVAAIVFSVMFSCIVGPGLAAMGVSFAVGFAAGFAIGVINGVNASRAFYTGMAFGMFCMNVGALASGGVHMYHGTASLVVKAATVMQGTSQAISIARGVTGAKSQRFDHRFDYVGHAGVGGNVMYGPLAGNTPWNYSSYLHDMAGAKEGYSEYYGSSLFPMPLTTDLGVWWRTYTGWSW